MNARRLRFLLALVATLGPAWTGAAQVPDLGGVKVSLPAYTGPATVRATRLEKYRLRLDVTTNDETRPLTVRIDLPESGPNSWPSAEVEVRAVGGQALLVERSGLEWSRLLVPLPAGVTQCIVEAVEPTGGWPRLTTDKDRTLPDATSGVRVRVARWPEGRVAALSLRFDDSHPTHLTRAVPILRVYGFRGTFMINPGAGEPGSRRRSNFQTHLAGWEALAAQGDQELANHTAHHRGASSDAEMEAEIGEAAQAIWRLAPHPSRLTALNLGGGTRWKTTRTLRYYLDKYHQFEIGGSLGMDDGYGNRPAAFREHLERHLDRGLWCRIHFHAIGPGLSSSEANFRAALEIAQQHAAELWIAGMADIHKYQTERDRTTLTRLDSTPHRLRFRLTCASDPALYDQPLTLEITLPATWSQRGVSIRDDRGPICTVTGAERKADGVDILRIAVPPRDAVYTLALLQ